MIIEKSTVIQQIVSAFSLSDESAQTAYLLLEARAKTLDFTFDEYIHRYHPGGIAERDENLSGRFHGYVEFLKDDATAILRAGKGASFSTFIHECAHVFRRQLTGELRDQADKAFGITGGIWKEEDEELFARGLEKYIKRIYARDKTREGIFNKGKTFVNTVYHGIDRIVEIDSTMEAVYEKLFTDNKYIYRHNEYKKILHEISEGSLPEESHVFLGMTPRIYEELGFQRLPMAITGKHLFSALHETGKLVRVHYHNLGEELLSQLPEQLKKPLYIVQSPNDPAEIISILQLKESGGNTVIVPIAQHMKGNITNAEIDINLVKTIFGKKGFKYWLKEAIEDERLLYINKKKTEPALGRKLNQHFPGPLRPPPDQIDDHPTTDVFGFIPHTIARYRKAVKQKYPQYFLPQGEKTLYKINENQQLSLDFSETVIPYSNTPEYFKRNFIEISGEFKNDSIEAARYLLRAMSKEDRETTLETMKKSGCIDKESYHNYLLGILSSEQDAVNNNSISIDVDSKFRPFGAWTDFNERLSTSQRERYNSEALAIIEKVQDEKITEDEKTILRRYSGFGGISGNGERGVLYDFYTSPPVARLVWNLLEKTGGITDGDKILEPSCGTGMFFEFAPQNKKIEFTGVELDSRTAEIAQHLHSDQNVEILHQSFEEFNLSDKAGGYDHIVGNVPFGERTITFASLDMPGEKNLDNYFVSRCIDNLKDNGTLALITASGVLENRSNDDFRLSLHKKAQFIGAVKLPNRSFHHTHTQVTPDILLFRKFPEDIIKRLSAIDDETFKTTALYNNEDLLTK